MPTRTRRAFLATGSSWLACAALGRAAQNASGPRIDAARLRQNIEALSAFGRPDSGTFADGVSRVAYSDADIAGRRYVMGLMRAAGLTPRIDAAGNIFALRAGNDPSLRPIAFGSHIDSVPQGGNFDGDLGSLAAIEIARTLSAASLVTRHPLEIVVWAHEEGGTFPNSLNGSRAVAGHLIDGELDVVYAGCVRRMGSGGSAAIRTGSAKRAAIAAPGMPTSSSTSNRAARSTRPVSRSASSKASCRFRGTRRRSRGSRTMRARR